MRNRSYDDRVAEVTRRRLEVLAAELGVDLDATSTEADTDPDPDPDPEAAPEPGAGAALAETRPGRHARRPVRPVRRVTLWIADRLPAGSGRRLDLGAAHVGLVALALAGGLLLTAWLVLRSSPSGTAAPPRVSAPLAQSASSAPGSPGAGPVAPSASPTGADLVIDVVGKVRDPGIAVLPPGSRVVDALEAAGGARAGADLSALNLARPLTDGEQVVVGRPAGAALPLPGSGAASPTSALVNLNTADQAALETLPGVGPVTAAAILQWRADHGAFSAVEELLEVSGIGDATLAEIAPHVTL